MENKWFYRYIGRRHIPGGIVQNAGKTYNNPRTGYIGHRVRYPLNGKFEYFYCDARDLVLCNPPPDIAWLADMPELDQKKSEIKETTMPFETFAIVELMGHQRIAGKVSEQVVAATTLLRVDVPKTSSREAYTKMFGASAIYCITPTDEATAQLAAEQFDLPPVSPYILRMPENPALAEKVATDSDEGNDYDYHDRWNGDDD